MASATPSSTGSPTPASAATALDAQTLQAWQREHPDLIVLDVRSAAEFESLHIAGSINVPLPLLKDHADSVATRLGGRVVLVCQSGVRAEEARRTLAGAGIDSAHVLVGGVPGLAVPRFPVTKWTRPPSISRRFPRMASAWPRSSTAIASAAEPKAAATATS